ncbi:MAG: hypothetical protein KGZ68_04170 [Dechloromonas sp.]|jgi:hypothetical protein|nr:hypothetical protein [Dechloromonas sp.]
MVIQAVDRKRCASCERWTGPRQRGDSPDIVCVESETVTGLCNGGGWHDAERRARSACGHWLRWLALARGAETDPAPPGKNG